MWVAWASFAIGIHSDVSDKELEINTWFKANVRKLESLVAWWSVQRCLCGGYWKGFREDDSVCMDFRCAEGCLDLGDEKDKSEDTVFGEEKKKEVKTEGIDLSLLSDLFCRS